MIEFYSVEATWRRGRQSERTHVEEYLDRGAAMNAGRRLAVRQRRVRVLRVIGDPVTGWLEPQLVGLFSADMQREAGASGNRLQFQTDAS